MSKLLRRLAAWMIRLPALAKMAIVFVADWMILCAAAFAAEYLAHGRTTVFTALAPSLAILALCLSGAYRVITRFVTPTQFLPLAAGSLVGGAIAAVLMGLLKQPLDPAVAIQFISTSGLALIVLRAVVARALRPEHHYGREVDRAVLYGAGSAGVQLAAALQISGRFKPVAFVDDDPNVQGRSLLGIPVMAPSRLAQICASERADCILLAMPSVRGSRRRQLLERLARLGTRVMAMPSLESLASGHQKLDELQEVQIEDLLARDSIPPKTALLERHIRDRVVMVTGAAGSIGSELCRQAIASRARRLVMLDHSEYGLYALERELRHRADGCELILALANVNDEAHLRRIIRGERVDTVYHAAAYKHVPLVEDNAIAAVTNNVFGTLSVVQAALDSRVSNLVLVSTDKAVRPTSVMGASKRICELIVQALAAHDGRVNMFIVRFGNVLASSGSVIPLFHEQIRNGGPVTVTHPEATRYFMTIREAAQLVVQAGGIGSTGDVFVLDMGEPIKIMALAERMIQLSGLEVRTPGNPEADIAIDVIGLRPGEKLHEELFIGSALSPTLHPRIYKASETFLLWPELQERLGALRIAMAEGNQDRVAKFVHDLAREEGRSEITKDVASSPVARTPHLELVASRNAG